MKKFILFAILLSPWVVIAVTDVRVTNSPTNPVNVIGSLSIAPSSNASPVTSTYTVVSTTYPIAVSASLTLPALTTVTYNGVGQPVTSTSDYIVNPVTATFNGIGQPITSTYTTVVSTGIPIIPSAIAQPVVSTSDYIVNPVTATFNGIGQPTTSTSTYVVNLTSVTFNGVGMPVTSTNTQVKASTMGCVNGGSPFAIGQSTTSAVGMFGVGSSAAGSPLSLGIISSSTTIPASQADLTGVRMLGDSMGRPLVTGMPYQLTLSTYSVNVATQSSNEFIIISSATTSRYNYLCGCVFTNTSVSAVQIQLYQSSSTVANVDSFPLVVQASSTYTIYPGCENPFFRSQFNGQVTLRAGSAQTSVLMRCHYYIGP